MERVFDVVSIPAKMNVLGHGAEPGVDPPLS